MHTLIKEYYQFLLPKDKDYFLHAFTMKKGSNYYGLIFCSGHSFGMEKFMRVCWKVDPEAGESNCEVGGFLGRGSFFPAVSYTHLDVHKRQVEWYLPRMYSSL